MIKDTKLYGGREIKDLKHMFNTSVEMFGSNPAYYVKKNKEKGYEPISYSMFKRDVDALGTSLMKMKMKGKKIGIISENRYEWAVSYFSVVCGVGIVVPIDKELPEEEIKYILEASGVNCVIYSGKFAPFFESLELEAYDIEVLINLDRNEDMGLHLSYEDIIRDGKELVSQDDKSFVNAKINRDEMSILLYTSGTSGLAKGVMLSHANIANNLMDMICMIKVTEEDIFFSILPLHHTYAGTCDLLLPFYRGAALGFSESLKQMVKNLEELKPTVFLGVPLIFESMYKKIWQNIRKNGLEKKVLTGIKINNSAKKVKIDLSKKLFKQVQALFGGRMRLMISGGAAIDPDVLQGYRNFGILAIQGYGMTEGSPILAVNSDKKPNNRAAGRMIPNVQLKIDNPNEDGVGEITAQGKSIMLGYYNNPKATAEALEDGWLHTGDLGYIDAEGYLYITGRKKNVIIARNGKNVFPEELEYYLSRIPYVSESLVTGQEGKDGAEILISAQIIPDYERIEESLGSDYTESQIYDLMIKEVDALNDPLPFYKKIKKVTIRNEAFSKTTTKKIKRYEESGKEN